MARKLKVFCYTDGFHSWTVAAPSRAKALEAWGVKRDLFKDGSAREIDVGPDKAAAFRRQQALDMVIGAKGATHSQSISA